MTRVPNTGVAEPHFLFPRKGNRPKKECQCCELSLLKRVTGIRLPSLSRAAGQTKADPDETLELFSDEGKRRQPRRTVTCNGTEEGPIVATGTGSSTAGATTSKGAPFKQRGPVSPTSLPGRERGKEHGWGGKSQQHQT